MKKSLILRLQSKDIDLLDKLSLKYGISRNSLCSMIIIDFIERTENNEIIRGIKTP